MWWWLACAHVPGGDALGPNGYRGALGTVHAVAGTWAIEPDADDSQRLCLDGDLVAEGMEVEGARVRFSGQALPVAPHERRACLSFAFTALGLAQ